jgi:hypothetical protein
MYWTLAQTTMNKVILFGALRHEVTLRN